MRPVKSLASAAAVLLALLGLVANGSAFADPPSQAARLAYIAGDVSFSPAGDGRWVQARVNRPLTVGDRLWTDRGSRAEIQVAGAVLRMAENTSVEFLDLSDNLVQVQVDEGRLDVRARRLGARQAVEVATPNLAFTMRRTGSYRIDVDPASDTTAIAVRSGRGEVYGDQASYSINSRQSYRFSGTGLRSYEYVDAPRAVEFDRWASARDRRADSSASARYVSRDVIGYEDLDANGTWRNEPGYGRVWAPNRVAQDWTPYREGHWAWVEPWGWSWVDDAPWGYAVSHYGRWANVSGQWVWVPGPAQSKAVYAPAVVGFVGGNDYQGGAGNVGWFPLGPREVYRPSYQTSRGYFDNINRGGTNAPPATISNAYGNTTASSAFMNQGVQGAIVAVLASVFAQSQSVAKATVAVPQAAAKATVAIAPPVAPTQQSTTSAAPAAKVQPPARTRERRIVARSAPPEAAKFAPQQKDATATTAPKPAAPAPAKSVVVVAQPQKAEPTAPPPAKAPEGKPPAVAEKPAERKGEDRKDPVAATAPSAPVAKAAEVKPVAKAPESPSAKAPEQKPAAAAEKSAERKGEDRKAPVAATPPSAPAAKAAEEKPVAKAAEQKPATPAPVVVAQAPAAKAAPDAGKRDETKRDETKRDDGKKGDAKRDDRRRAREDKRRVEEDKRRTDEDKRRAGEDKKTPETESRRAEEDKRRAGEDTRRAEEDKRRAAEDKK